MCVSRRAERARWLALFLGMAGTVVAVAQNSLTPDALAIDALRNGLTSAQSPAEKLGAEFNLARLLSRYPDHRPEAEHLYKEILSSGSLDSALRLRCLNDYGSLLLDGGDKDSVRSVFATVQSILDSGDVRLAKVDEARYRFNIANMQEKTHAIDFAFPSYERVLDVDPDMEEACAALTDLAAKNVGTTTLASIRRRFEQHDYICAGSMLAAALGALKWQADDGAYSSLLTTWTRYLTVSRTTMVAFESRWQGVTYRGQNETNQHKLDEIMSIYGAAPGDMVLDEAAAAALVCGWSRTAGDRRAFSNLLVLTVSHMPATRRAIARALLAWNTDRTNADAALTLADQIAAQPAAERAPLTPVMEQLAVSFEGGDTRTAARIHLILAHVYAESERWEGGGEDNVVRQTALAVDILGQQTASVSNDSIMAHAHALLAYAYAKTGCFDEAVRNYISAGLAYLKLSQWGSAEALSNAVVTLPVTLPPDALDAYSRIVAAVEEARVKNPGRNSPGYVRREALAGWLRADPELFSYDLGVITTSDILQITGTVRSVESLDHLRAVVARWPDAKPVAVNIAVNPR
jgi:tetratricopeptide (TPR) repeat protein